MNAVELEKELWKINSELVKAGIKPYQYQTMADAVAELRGQLNKYKALFDQAIIDRDRLQGELEAAQQPRVAEHPREGQDAQKHTYIEYHRKDIDGFLVKCDTPNCPSPAEIIIGMKMLCQPCAAREQDARAERKR